MFRDDVAEGGEAGGEPRHAGVEKAEGGYAAAVGDYVCRLERGHLVGGEEEVDFFVKGFARSIIVAFPYLLECFSELAGFCHGGCSLHPALRFILGSWSSDKGYISSARFSNRGDDIHTSIPLVALVVICNDL